MLRSLFALCLLVSSVLLLWLAPGLGADTLVVANKGEATASLLDLDTGEVVATLPTGDGPHEVAISPDGRRAVVTDYGRRNPGSSLTVLDIPSAAVVKTVDLGKYRRPHGVVFLDETRVVVTAEDNRALIEVDLESEAVVRALPTRQEISHMLAVSPDKSRAYVANIGSGSVSVFDLDAGERLANIATGEGAEGVAVAAGGSQVWVSNRAEDSITVLDAKSLKPLAEFPSEGFPIRAVATPDGASVLVTRARAGDLVVYDAASLHGTTAGGAKHTRSPPETRVVALGVSMKDTNERLFGDRFGDSSVPIGVLTDGAGKRVYIAHANADVITEHHLETGELLRTLTAGREPDGMGWSPVAVEAGTEDSAPQEAGGS